MRIKARLDIEPLRRMRQRAAARRDGIVASVSEDYAREIYAAARRRWPVKTGYTRRSLGFERLAAGARVFNTATDVLHVWLGHSGPAWRLLVTQPFRAGLPGFRKRLAAALARGLRG